MPLGTSARHGPDSLGVMLWLRRSISFTAFAHANPNWTLYVVATPGVDTPTTPAAKKAATPIGTFPLWDILFGIRMPQGRLPDHGDGSGLFPGEIIGQLAYPFRPSRFPATR